MPVPISLRRLRAFLCHSQNSKPRQRWGPLSKRWGMRDPQPAYPDEPQWAVKALAQLAGKLPPSEASIALDAIVGAIPETKDESLRADLARALEAVRVGPDDTRVNMLFVPSMKVLATEEEQHGHAELAAAGAPKLTLE